MFTGIIQAVGSLQQIEWLSQDARLCIAAEGLGLAAVQLGDSIAVNGVCLTVVELMGHRFLADVSRETLNLTTLGNLQMGSRVNLEKALTLQTPLGGHLVSGHVDGVGEVTQWYPEGRSWRLQVRAPAGLAKYIAPKGSIALDGISLTVNTVAGADFGLNIVPHTLEKTTLGAVAVGCRLNIEVDVVARYLERLLLGDKAEGQGAGVNLAFLQEHGFVN